MAGDPFYGPFHVRAGRPNSDGRALRMRFRETTAGEVAFLVHPVAGLQRDIDGDAWTLQIEWDTGGSGWGIYDLERHAAYDVQQGLVVTVRAHRGGPAAHVDLVVVLTSEDPDLAPANPGATPPDFTVPGG